jgi:hypothetical protein
MKSITAPAPAPPQRASVGAHLNTAAGVLCEVDRWMSERQYPASFAYLFIVQRRKEALYRSATVEELSRPLR